MSLMSKLNPCAINLQAERIEKCINRQPTIWGNLLTVIFTAKSSSSLITPGSASYSACEDFILLGFSTLKLMLEDDIS